MSYVNAPQTELIATHCAACGRPLVDAVSVETGMGPICRERLMGDVWVPEEARMEANKLVYQIAAIQKGTGILEPLKQVRELGFVKLADRIEKRLKMKPQVIIVEIDETLYVVTPYVEEATPAWRRIPGRRFGSLAPEIMEMEVKGNRQIHGNKIPISEKRALWNLLKKYYNGTVARGPKGIFVIDS